MNITTRHIPILMLILLTLTVGCGKKTPIADPVAEIPSAPSMEELYKEELFGVYRSLLTEPSTPMIVPPQTMRGYVVPHERIARNGSSTLIDEHYRYWQTGQAQWILEGLSREVE